MKKTHKVVMLSTEKASNIYLDGYNKLNLSRVNDTLNSHKQHLYIISDDEIKEGDWVYLSTSAIIGVFKVQRVDFEKNIHLQGESTTYQQHHLKKIVATTDLNLSMCSKSPLDRHMDCNGTASIPESFILAYIKAYNEGKPITEVDLEMITICTNCGQEDCDRLQCRGQKHISILKTRPDNTVIVYQSKTYSRDEVIAFAKKYAKRCQAPIQAGDEWIQDNL